ncbi:hypothetical protein KR51_00029390 [Rubidibacter lacunae KORDI 51-2]|uniref:HTH cro/C1-type domain-containing protein n=1 Tax=Rubidibacter lacunae KORDI 51-2 TaxID=582515 RepID=U5DFM9_9CHRO|nr:helix-turn-helix transcriptional regulator [Rubidibacter lacunae]ERN40401.1 hypothetical protein KR51_00029390 [Rubidibacter lacunae KORDI 51-2]
MSQPETITYNSIDRTQLLRDRARQVGLLSLRQICQQAGVSERQLRYLRRGQCDRLRVETLQRLARVLEIPTTDLLAEFASGRESASEPAVLQEPDRVSRPEPNVADMQRECQILQQQLLRQHAELQKNFQRTSLHLLEPWLRQWPSAIAGVQRNPELPAARLLPLTAPIDNLLRSWEVESIAAVGSELPYDPQWHQLLEGTAAPGDRVRVRYAGYRWGDKLLFRAQVGPVD